MPTDDTLTRRRVLGSLVTIGTAGAASGAGTAAYFTDRSSDPDSTVTASALNLQFDGSSTVGIAATLDPYEYVEGAVTLRNPTATTGSLDVDIAYTENDAAGADDITTDQVAQRLAVDRLEYGTTDLSGVASNLYELATRDITSGESTANDIVDLQDPGPGTDFIIGITFEPDSNSKKPDGDGIDVTVTFTLNQTDDQ